jgi:maltokinase
VIDTERLAELLAGHLPKQRWFGGGELTTAALEISAVTELRQGWPGALHVIAQVPGGEGGEGHRYQLVVGLRPSDEIEVFLEGKAEAYMGDVETTQGPAHAYDAVYDPELALDLLHHVAPDISAERARVLLVEQSNTSIVFDERHIMKLFRRLSDGGNPDIEVTTALARVGFEGVVRPEAVWQRDGDDLAVVNEFLAGASEGLSLALTSLRDLYDRRIRPEDCGGDFAPQARRLGIVTAKLHLALAEAFGTTDPDPRSWADDMIAQLERLGDDLAVDTAAVRARYDRLSTTADTGRAIRVHGDLHLGQVMRTDAGWFVLDFEGEPDRPVAERRRPSSPLRDVAGMLRSFHYAAEVALRDRGEEITDELAGLARAWEERNTFAFSEGYRAVTGIDALLPTDEGCDVVQSAFELDKAVYEVAYEQAHRPDWVAIPRAAVDRLLELR